MENRAVNKFSVNIRPQACKRLEGHTNILLHPTKQSTHIVFVGWQCMLIKAIKGRKIITLLILLINNGAENKMT